MRRLLGLVGLLVLVAGAWGQAEDTMLATLFTPKEAVFVLLPELAVAPHVDQYVWSPDGRYLLAIRVDAPRIDLRAIAAGQPGLPVDSPPASLVLYDLSRHESATLMNFPNDGRSLYQMGFTKTPGVAYVLATRTPTRAADGQELAARLRHILVRVSGADRKATAVAELRLQDVGMSPQLLVAPVSTVAVVHGTPVEPSEQGEPLIAYDSSGNRVASHMGGAGKAGLGPFVWSADGARLYARTQPYGPNSAKELIAFTAPRLEESKITGQPALYKEAESPDLALRTAAQRMTLDGVTKETSSLWLCSKEPSELSRALIGSSCWSGRLAPNGGAVAFVAQGAVYVRPIVRADKAAVLKAKEAAERAMALSDAKQIGLGLLMYAADSDQLLPDPASFAESVQPYLKNGSMLDRFHYTYQGDRDINKIGNPATTELGYMDGPGGRAVLYADGHVIWVPNP